jgi:hypothetical protein
VLWGARTGGTIVPVLPLLWLAALPAAVCLVRRYGWGSKELVGLTWTRSQALHLLLRLLAAAGVLAAGSLLLAPDRLFELPAAVRGSGCW